MHDEGVRAGVHEHRAGYLGRQGEEHERVGRRGSEWMSRGRPRPPMSLSLSGESARRRVGLGLYGGGGESRVWQEGWEFQKANRFQGRRRSGAELTELDRVFCALEEG